MTAHSILYPLSEFYEELGLALPEVRQVEPSEMPEAERRLLVHENDMTPTLETAHGGELELRVIRYAADEQVVRRLVALVLPSGVPVEIGAIRIVLENLPPAARRLVVERREPFGSILQRHGVPHYSRPAAFFEVTPDAMVSRELGLDGVGRLYGRQNRIWSESGAVLAEVVEILPP